MDLNSICHPSPATKMKCSFLDYVQLLMIGWAGQWTRTPSVTPLQPKNKIFIFGLRSTSDDRPDWLMDLNPICHPTPAKKWNAHFWITFNFWWLVELEPHLPPLSSPKNKMAGQWTSNPGRSATHPSPVKKWNAHFWITFNFWWSAGLVVGLEPHLPPLSSQKNKMLIFGLCSTSDDWPGWLMDSKPCLPPLSSQKNKILIFGLRLTSDDWLGWSMDSKPIHHPSAAKKLNAHFWITLNFWWSARLVNGLETHPSPLSSQK